jgi:hypothetical protein
VPLPIRKVHSVAQYERAGEVAPDAEALPLFECLHFMERGISSEEASTEAYSAMQVAIRVAHELCGKKVK